MALLFSRIIGPYRYMPCPSVCKYRYAKCRRRVKLCVHSSIYDTLPCGNDTLLTWIESLISRTSQQGSYVMVKPEFIQSPICRIKFISECVSTTVPPSSECRNIASPLTSPWRQLTGKWVIRQRFRQKKMFLQQKTSFESSIKVIPVMYWNESV